MQFFLNVKQISCVINFKQLSINWSFTWVKPTWEILIFVVTLIHFENKNIALVIKEFSSKMKYMGVHKVAKLISPSTEMSDVFKSLI